MNPKYKPMPYTGPSAITPKGFIEALEDIFRPNDLAYHKPHANMIEGKLIATEKPIIKDTTNPAVIPGIAGAFCLFV